MVNKLAAGAMKKKSKLSPAPPLSKPQMPRPNSQVDGPDMEYRAREALHDIVRVESHKRDPKLMKAVKGHVEALNAALGGGLTKGGKR